MENGASAEIAVTGNDGLVGIALFMGGESTSSRAVVQSAGYGYRLRAAVLKKEFELGGTLQHLALRYTQALITQMSQTAYIPLWSRPGRVVRYSAVSIAKHRRRLWLAPLYGCPIDRPL